MLTVMRKSAIFFLFLIAFTSVISLSSCYKEPKEGNARIIVIDENQLRVPYATVRLYQGDINYVNNSDFDGIAMFENLLEVILTVEAKKGAKQGNGIARIKPDQTITEVVTIY